jgi:hypothetical protein
MRFFGPYGLRHCAIVLIILVLKLAAGFVSATPMTKAMRLYGLPMKLQNG